MNNTTNTLPAVRAFDEIQIADGKIAITTGAAARAFADFAIKSGFAPKGMNAEGVALSVICGASRGIDPFAAMQGIAVVNGRPTLWGDQLAAVVKGSSVFGGERVEYYGAGDDAGVRFTVWRKGEEDNPTVETFAVRDAKRAGLWDKPGPWKQYPRQMLFNRARAFAYRHAFPDALMGMRFREEEEDAAPVDVTPAPAIKPVPADEAPKPPRRSKLRAALDIPDAEIVPEPPPERVFAPAGEETPPETPVDAPSNAQDEPDASEGMIHHLDD